MEKPARRLVWFVAVLIGVFALAVRGQNRHPSWSADLVRYGYPAERHGAATVPYSDAALAVSESNVLLAFNVTQGAGMTSNALLNSPWQFSLLIFNAENGNLRAQCGPWIDGSFFEVWATDRGNFLVHLHPPHDDRGRSTEQVLVLSPACQVLQRLQLPLLADENRDYSLLLSPSGHTLLISIPTAQGLERDLRDADTLAVRTSWVDTEKGDPQIVSISDSGLLGLKSASQISTGIPVERIFYRTFEAHQWREILDEGPSQLTTFISNDAFIETAATGSSNAWATSEVRIAIRKLEGTTAFSTAISRRNANISPGSPFAVSPSGHYFGVVLSSYSVDSFWRFFDMSPGHDEAYIWSLGSAQPVARINVRSGSLELGQQLAFAPDDSWFALRSGKTVVVRPLPHLPL